MNSGTIGKRVRFALFQNVSFIGHDRSLLLSCENIFDLSLPAPKDIQAPSGAIFGDFVTIIVGIKHITSPHEMFFTSTPNKQIMK